MKTEKSKLYKDSPLGLAINRILSQIRDLNKQFGFPKKKGASTQEERDAERILEIARAVLHFIDTQGPKFDNNSAPGIGGMMGAAVDVLKLAKSLALKKTPAGDSKIPDISLADNYLTHAMQAKLLTRATDAMFDIINKHLVSPEVKHYEREPNVDAIQLTEELFNTIRTEFTQWLTDNDTSDNKVISKIAIETFNQHFTFAYFENGIPKDALEKAFSKLSHAVQYSKGPLDTAITTKQQKMLLKSRSAPEKVFSFFKIVSRYLVGTTLAFHHDNFKRVISHEATYRLAMTLFDVFNTTPDSIEELLSFLDVDTPLKLINIPLPMLPPEVTINLKPDPAKLKPGKKTPDQSYAIALAYFKLTGAVIAEMVSKYLAEHPERAIADFESHKVFSLYLTQLATPVTEIDLGVLANEERKLAKILSALDEDKCGADMIIEGETTKTLPGTILHLTTTGSYTPVYFPDEIRKLVTQRLENIKAQIDALKLTAKRKPLTQETLTSFVNQRLLIKKEIDDISEKIVANAGAQFIHKNDSVKMKQLNDELILLRSEYSKAQDKIRDNTEAHKNLIMETIEQIKAETLMLVEFDASTISVDSLSRLTAETTSLDSEIKLIISEIEADPVNFVEANEKLNDMLESARRLDEKMVKASDDLEAKRKAVAAEETTDLPDISDQPLYAAIMEIKKHGEKLKDLKSPKDIACGEIAIHLSADLEIMAKKFFAKPADKNATEEFKSRFLTLLHSQDKVMNTHHRGRWKIILANVAIACSGIGAVALAVRYASRRNTGREFLFFAETKGRRLVSNVERVALKMH